VSVNVVNILCLVMNARTLCLQRRCGAPLERLAVRNSVPQLSAVEQHTAKENVGIM
jgi:hypothetical protein